MSDSINRQDALDALGEEPEVWDDADEFANGMRMQWNCDRKAIEALPSIRTQMSSADCISRQDAIDAVDVSNLHRGIVSALQEILRELPSAERKGHWVETDAYPHRVYCSNCYKTYLRNKEWIDELGVPMNFCPNCGANMK